MITTRWSGNATLSTTLWRHCRAAAGQLDVSQVGTAILETNGQLSAFPDSKYRPANTSELHISPDPESVPTVLMLDGRADDENLALLGRDGRWLRDQLASVNLPPSAR